MASTFSLKQGETRTSHGPIPHPLTYFIPWIAIRCNCKFMEILLHCSCATVRLKSQEHKLISKAEVNFRMFTDFQNIISYLPLYAKSIICCKYMFWGKKYTFCSTLLRRISCIISGTAKHSAITVSCFSHKKCILYETPCKWTPMQSTTSQSEKDL